MHGLIDPIMGSPIAQATSMEELDELLAQLILNEIGEVPLDAVDVLGTKTVSSVMDLASEFLPKITAVQFAAQIMFQLQVGLAPVMAVMKNTTVKELIEPIMHVMAIIPNATPSEAAHMLAEPIMKNMDQMSLGTADEKTAVFIGQLQGPTKFPRLFNSNDQAVGSKTASAIRDFSASMLPRKSPGDVAKSMMDKVDFMRDNIGPSFDRPVGEMINDLMNSTPDDLMHGLIDPIMGSPIAQANTMDELDTQLAQLIQKEIGEVPLDAVDVLGTKTISSLMDFASEVLPKITAAQFAAQIMFQLQVEFAPVMAAMKSTTVRELVEPMMHAMAIIPNVNPSEAAHMLAEPIIKNMGQVALGTTDEKTAEFIGQLQEHPRTLNSNDQVLRSRNPIQHSGIQSPESTDFAYQEEIDQLRVSNAPQNTETQTQFNEQALIDQGIQGHAIQDDFNSISNQDLGHRDFEAANTVLLQDLNQRGNENQNTPQFLLDQSQFGPLIQSFEHGFIKDNRFDGSFLDQTLNQVSGDSNSHSQDEFGAAENQNKRYYYPIPERGLNFHRD